MGQSSGLASPTTKWGGGADQGTATGGGLWEVGRLAPTPIGVGGQSRAELVGGGAAG